MSRYVTVLLLIVLCSRSDQRAPFPFVATCLLAKFGFQVQVCLIPADLSFLPPPSLLSALIRKMRHPVLLALISAACVAASCSDKPHYLDRIHNACETVSIASSSTTSTHLPKATARGSLYCTAQPLALISRRNV